MQLRAKNYIVNSISNTQLELIISENSAKKMIDKLDELYLRKSSALKLLCKRKLLDLKMKENENPTEFFNKFEKLINELKNAGETVNKDDKLNYLLLTLPESLSHVADIVDALPDKDKTVEFIKSKLMLEYEKCESSNEHVKGKSQSFNSQVQRNISGNQSQKGNFMQRNGDQKSNKNYYQQKQCYKCNKFGHIARFCRSNANTQNNRGRNFNRNNNSTVSNTTVEEKDKYSTFNVQVMASDVDTKNKNKEIKWLIDSGCSNHIVNSDEYFSSSRMLQEPINVKVGDGYSLKSNLIGNISVQFKVGNSCTKVEIKDVYCVPQMKLNLLSVSSMIKNKNEICFKDNKAEIYNSRDEKIAVARLNEKLFELSGVVVKNENQVLGSNSCFSEMTKKEKWHRRLGHTNFRDLKYLCENQMLHGIPKTIENEYLNCEICLESKMSNLRFKNDRTRANDVLEIVHTDVNGPITQTGYEGEKYFVIFVDDYSKFVVVYCIKNKSQVYSCFESYINLMENKTNKKIKEIHCDNGKEYINKDFFELARKKGIHIRACPAYTHQLNGVAEMYNRTLMDRTRCLLKD